MKKILYIAFLIVFAINAKAQTELVSTGTGAAYALSYPAAFTYSSGITITFKAHTVNTGAATLNVNGLGTKDIFKNVTTPLAFGDIAAGKFVTVIYDGTNFQLTTPVSSSSTPSWALAGNAGTTSAANFIGTTDAVDLVFRTDNIEKLRIKSTGNIGIGTTNPLYKLHLYSTANNGSDIVSETDGGRIIKHWFQNGGRSWSIGQTGTTSIPQYNFVITDETAGTSRLAINTNGDVGVGTTDPATNLHIRGVGVATTLLQNADQIIDKDKPIAQLSFSDALTTDAQAAITVIRDEASSNASDVPTAITFSTVKDGNNALSIVERMRINSGGWVGIGTTIPQDMLSVGTFSQFMVGDNGEIKRIKGLNYTWPNAHTAGVLQNDGTGALSFGALPSGANAWTKSGSSIFQTTLTDNVGVGTNAPGKIAGVSRYLTIAQGDSYNSQNVSLELQGSTVMGTNGSVSRIDFINYNGLTNHLARVEAKTGSSSNNGRLVFSTHDGTSLTERMKIMDDGKIGVGLASGTNPIAMLDVAGDLALRQASAPDAITFTPLDATARSLMNMNALTTNFEIRSIRGTGDGKVLTIINPTAFIMSIRDQSSGFGLTSERVITGTGGTVSYPGPCVVTLVYNSVSNRWFISSVASGASNANLWSKTGSTTYLTNSTDFIGIGTSTPTERFHILSTDSDIDAETVSGTESSSLHIKRAAGTLTTPTLVPNGQYFGGIAFQGYDGTAYREGARIQASVDGVTGANDMPGRLEFWTTADGSGSATEAMRITNSNRVGIGSTTPNAKLQVLASNTADFTALRVEQGYTGTSTHYGLNILTNNNSNAERHGIYNYVLSPATATGATYGMYNRIYPAGTNTAYAMYNFIDPIGTGIRYGLYLDVNTSAANTSATYGQYTIMDNDGSGGSYGLYINSIGSTTGTEYGAYITGEDFNYFSGSVRIGNNTSTEKFVAEHAVSGLYTARINNLANSTTAHGMIVRAGDNTTGGSTMIRFYRGDGSSIGQIQQNSATSVQYLTTSDRNLKNLYGETKYGLADLMKIKIYDYSYKDDVNKKKMTGFVAQELYEAFPQSVAAPNGKKDDNGNEVPWMVDYGSVTPLLVKSIQDQQKLIEDLQKQIDLLKQQINTQENK